MVYGIGIDIVNIRRLEKAFGRWQQRLLFRLFSPKEIEECKGKKRFYQSLAGKLAAKEAVSKALGSGLSNGISWKEIEILKDKAGRPKVAFSPELDQLISQLGIKDCFISISHEADYAIAQAILIKEG